MFSTVTRFKFLLEELSERHRDGTEFPANISSSHIDTGVVLPDHGGE